MLSVFLSALLQTASPEASPTPVAEPVPAAAALPSAAVSEKDMVCRRKIIVSSDGMQRVRTKKVCKPKTAENQGVR